MHAYTYNMYILYVQYIQYIYSITRLRDFKQLRYRINGKVEYYI
jgi:hypothetical protein